ncbi:MAG TPA: O-antigen ligase family protein [Verrucomicrobiae bacterium]|nr:O-antigen ligase family protein [Verrucomicrobiae bacterium]
MGRTLKENLLLGGITAFGIGLFLPDMPVVANVFIALLFIHCFFFDSVKTRRLCLVSRPMLLFLLLFYALQMLSAAFSANRPEAIELLVRRCPLVVFPLCIGSIYIRARLYRRILLSFAIVTTAAALVCLTASVVRAWRLGDTQWLYDDSLTHWMDRPSTYMAWMVTIALYCYFAALRGMTFTPKRRRTIYAAMGFLLIFHYLLASRSSLIFLYTSVLVLAVYHTRRSRNPVAIAVLTTLPIAAIAIILLFPKTINRFRELQYTGYDLHSEGAESHYNMPVTKDQWNGANIRLAIWNCGLDLARQHWLLGVPLGDKDTALQTEYKTRGFTFAYDRKRNLHNTYLDVLVNTGIPGLLIFALACVILPLIRAVKQKSTFGFVVSAAIAMAIFTENWLDQSQGCLLLGFWLSFIPAGYCPLSRMYNRTASSVSPKKTRLPWAI